MNENEKQDIRNKIIEFSKKLLGIPYALGAEWTDYSKLPEHLDCSELVEGLYKIHNIQMPDGAQRQYESTVPIQNPQIGDLAFFGKGKNPSKIYHVGLLFDDKQIIEAREFDGRAWTGKVVLRDRSAWENWKNFIGYRASPFLV